jgi:hypothetical protein
MTNSARRDAAAAMASAAQAWLDMLDASQRPIAVAPFPTQERLRWFYTPTDHGGLTVHQQRPAQQRAAMKLVASGLSTPGYVTVATVMGLENVLDHTEGFVARFDRERGRDPGLYYLRVFGDPASGTWGWRFGGHHVSLNNVVVDGALVSTTPCFLGADPATSELLGGAVNRPLGRVEDLGRELVRSLHPDQALIAAKAPSDLGTGNRSTITEADTARPKGAAAGTLSADQRELLRALVATYLGRGPLPFEVPDDLYFAWAGSTEPGEPHYYRVQGPNLLLEWDNTQRNANHAHSVWRSPENDFGLDVLGEHRRNHH